MKGNQQGFSLIELSIVLIIIGLLVAGITGGASLINSAKLRSTMSEVTNYRIAVNNYYNMTDGYPGDAAVAEGTGGAAIDVKNGKILGDEFDYTWDAMADVDLLDNSSSYAESAAVAAASGYTVYTGLAYTKVSKSGWMMGYYTAGEYNAIALTLEDTASTAVTKPATVSGIVATMLEPSVTGVDAGVMDTKMDDGTYNTGNVRSLDCSDYTSTSIACSPLFTINL